MLAVIQESTMRKAFNYKHLYYFWVVAKEGGMVRASERLDMTVQTISAQVRALERDLGYALLKPAGRGLALTDAGTAALRQADQIFQMGERLPEIVKDAASTPRVRFAVGISDGLPKTVVQKLLEPILGTPDLHLICHEGELDELLGELALHRLDLVFADRQAPANPNIKLYTHSMGASPVAWYSSPVLAQPDTPAFPQCLAHLPVLLPTHHNAMRARLDLWFEQEGIQPRIVGEFEDSALLSTFGASGMGLFPAIAVAHDGLLSQLQLKEWGRSAGVEEHIYAIGAEKKVHHPLIQRLVSDRSDLPLTKAVPVSRPPARK
jgi:LysR family transcriptional activator of nhaA